MTIHTLRALAITVIAGASLALIQAAPAQAQDRRPSDLLELGSLAKVERVIDGDTIEVSQAGKTFTVTYLGLDAPALDACFGAQARQANAALVQGRTVVIEQDTTDRDTSGLAPRYVYLLDGRMVNEELLKAGQAAPVTQLSDAKYQAKLNVLAAQAQQARRGGWARCGWQAQVTTVAPGECLQLTTAELAQRVEKPSVLGALSAGDCVTISQPATAGAPAWSGRYIYRPAGSTVQLGQGFVRWKDGFVLLDWDSSANGELAAHVDLTRPGPPVRLTFGGRVFNLPGKNERFQAVLPLERDPGDASIVRLPAANTWVFRDLGGGQFQALTDFFEYQSGGIGLPE